MKQIGKLVRDKIPAIVAANGETAITRTLQDDEYLQELINKLGEEYDEFKAALSVEELADVQEVVLALADHITSRNEPETVRVAKLAERGAFTQKIYLEGKE